MSMLRSVLFGGALLSVLWSSAANAQYPYEAFTTKKVHVRSGDSENYYATALLDSETRITVVADAGNGWLAIEPPEGSFSWISSDFVRSISANQGEVTGNNVTVRIGTPFDSRKKDSWNRQLNRGDRVQILEAPRGDDKFYKIVPPAGEVRFITAQYVRPASGQRVPSRNTGAASAVASGPRDLSTSGAKVQPKRKVEEPVDDDSGSDESAPPTASTRAPRTPLEHANAAYQEMLRKPLPERNTSAVRALFERAAESARTDSEHAMIASRLESLQLIDERKSKFDEFDRALVRAKQRDETLLAIPRKSRQEESPEPDEPATPQRGRYDASGMLRRSNATIDGKPAYVLLSPQGGIRYYVTASQGVDLSRYLDKVVAVRGISNYRIEVRAQHITVREITVIDLNQSDNREARGDRGNRRS